MNDTPQTPLFTDDLSANLDEQLKTVGRKVEEMPQHQFLATHPDTLIEQLVGELSVEPLVLHDERMHKDSSPIEIRLAGRPDFGKVHAHAATRSGRRLRYGIPFSGDAELWQMKASYRSPRSFLGEVDTVQRTLTLSFESASDEKPEWDDRKYREWLEMIGQHILSQAEVLDQYHDKLHTAVQNAVKQRSLQLKPSQDLAAARRPE
jgi:hypothetical protein